MFETCLINGTIPSQVTGKCYFHGTKAECDEGELIFLDEKNFLQYKYDALYLNNTVKLKVVDLYENHRDQNILQ